MARTVQTPPDLEENLQEQLHFLKTSGARFDHGDTHEAKRIAIAVRILCHSSRTSHGLAAQLGITQSRLFFTSAMGIDPENLLSQSALVSVAQTAKGMRWLAPLDDTPMTFVSFEDWWNEPVLWDRQSTAFSRAALVLAMANQDGGAHVDPAIDTAYADIRNGTLNWQVSGDVRGMRNPERHAVRQIGHELIKSLVPSYKRKRQVRDFQMIFRNPSIRIGTEPVGINPFGQRYEETNSGSPCPCGSQLMFSECHELGVSK